MINNRWDAKVGDVYQNGMKQVTRAIGEAEDRLLSKIPWEFQALKDNFAALKSTYEDVLKADIKNQRNKWIWLVQSYSRIEWVADILWWSLSVLTRGGEWLKDVVKWAGKLLMWKSLKKATDPDFLIKEWFEWLVNKLKAPKIKAPIAPANSKATIKSPTAVKETAKKTVNESIPELKATVKAPEELYHTSTQEILKLTDDKVLRTTPDSKYTLKYWKKWSRNTYKIDSEWLNILDWTSKKGIDIIEWINKKLWDKWFSAWVLSDDGKVISFVLKDKNFVAELKKMWYDWLRTTESSMKWWVESVWIITPSKIKSLEVNNKWLKPKNESIPQLKATVKAPDAKLVSEAKISSQARWRSLYNER